MSSVSVIIPTVGRPSDLAMALRAIQKSSKNGLCEVIVIGDGCDPLRNVPPVRGLEVVSLETRQRRGAATARNVAARRARGEILAFLDDDSQVAEDWFDVIAGRLTTSVGAITGYVAPSDDGLLAAARQLRYERRYAAVRSGDPVDFMAGGNSAVWRWAFEEVGGFPDIRVMSDSGLCRRLAEKRLPCVFTPEMLVVHRHSKGIIAAVSAAWQSGRLRGSSTTHTWSQEWLTLWRVAASGASAACLVNTGLHLVHLGGAVTGWVSRLGGVVIAKDGDNQHANGKSAFDRTPEGRH